MDFCRDHNCSQQSSDICFCQGLLTVQIKLSLWERRSASQRYCLSDKHFRVDHEENNHQGNDSPFYFGNRGKRWLNLIKNCHRASQAPWCELKAASYWSSLQYFIFLPRAKWQLCSNRKWPVPLRNQFNLATPIIETFGIQFVGFTIQIFISLLQSDVVELSFNMMQWFLAARREMIGIKFK